MSSPAAAGSRQPRVVVVVGASSGIGRASAIAFSARGDTVVLSSRSETTLRQAEADCRAAAAAQGVPGARTLVVPADVTDHEAMERLVRRVVDELGHIDVWVHSAAVIAYGTVAQVPPPVFARVVQTNLVGTANALAAVLPHFRERQEGSFVGVTSLLGHIPVPTMGAYVSSKWGVRGLLRSAELEVRDLYRVHVSAVSPGAIDTPIYRNAASYLGRQGRPPPPVTVPEKVARAVVAAADRPRRERSVGLANHVVRAGWTLLPPVYDALVGPLIGYFGTSRDPVPEHPGNVFAPRPEQNAVRGGYNWWGRDKRR